MSDFYIRPATEQDIPRVCEIYDEIHSAEEEGLLSTGWVRGVYPVEETARDALLRDELFVCLCGGEIAASAIINKTQPDSYKEGNWQYSADAEEVMVLHTLCVSPRILSRGCGRFFVSYYEDFAKQQSCGHLRIDTQAKNLRARKLYASLGYREIGIVPCVFNGIEGVELVLMEKKL